MNSQIVTVNLVPGLSAPAVIRVSQYDVGRPLTIRVLDGTGAASFGSSVTATIVGTKPSGLGFTQSGLITGSTVTLNTTLAMTQECGMIPAEIRFTQNSENVGTANFILAVEPSPHPEGTTDGTQETMADLETRLQGQINDLDARVDAIEGDQSIIDEIDALDDRVTALEQGSGLTDDVKEALLQIAQKVWYVDSGGQTYYNALYNALYPPADLVSISAVYTQSGTVYDTDTLDSLKSDLVVTAHMSDQTTRTVTDYTLSGTLVVGTSTITVGYGGKSTTFDVVVSEIPVLTATPSKKTIPSLNTTTGFWQTTTSSNSAAYCGFLFDESMTGGTISLDWDTDDHSILDVIVTAETDEAWSGIRTHTSKHETYGMDATVTGFSSAFYWYKFGEAYQATGSVPTVYQPTANTGTATVELPEGYKAFLVSVRRNSNSTSVNGLATDNTSFNTWAYSNVTVTVRGGVINE